MRGARLAAAALCVCLCLLGAARVTSAASVLTLDDALARVEYHSDYQAWQENLDGTIDAREGILDKHALTLDVSGTLLAYSYTLDTDSSKLSSAAGLSLSKSTIWGTSLQGRVTPSVNLREGSLNTTWSLELNQTIWPRPQYGADQIALEVNQLTRDTLIQQRDYVVANAQFKIERLYRAAQLAEARLALSEERLEAARQNLAVLERKRALGEAGEMDMISGELSVLRAERELETSRANAATAKRSLLEAISLDGDYQLAPLDPSLLPEDGEEVNVERLLAAVHQHPLVLAYQVDLAKAERELESTTAAGKPQASFRMSLAERTTQESQGTVFEAAVTIGYPLLDGNQREKTLRNLADARDKAQESYEDAVENVKKLIADAAAELDSLARDRQIAWLALRQAELEWQAAQIQYHSGVIDGTSLQNAELQLKQAQLDYFESAHNYDWARRRLSLGIVGDLPGMGGAGR